MRIWTLTKKDLSVILRDRASLVWLFILPIVFLIIFAGLVSLAMDGSSEAEEEDTRLVIFVVNEDLDGELAQEFIDHLNKVGGYRVEELDRATADQRLSKLVINRYLVLPDNFSADLEQGKAVSLPLVLHPNSGQNVTEIVLRVVEGVARDMALELQLYDGIQRMGEMQAGNPDALEAFDPERVLAQAKSQFERSRLTPLVEIEQESPSSGESKAEEEGEFDLSRSIVPGMTVLFVFLAAPTVARGIYEERKMGSLRRLLAAPLSRSELMFGKLLPILLLVLAQIVIMFAFGALILPLLGIGRLGIGEDPLGWGVASLVIALCSTSLGILIAAVARSEGQISGLGNALMWVAGFLGGALLPAFLIDQITPLNILSRLVPQYWAIQTYTDLLARGKSLVDVLPALGILMVFSVVFFFIGVRRFKFE